MRPNLGIPCENSWMFFFKHVSVHQSFNQGLRSQNQLKLQDLIHDALFIALLETEPFVNRLFAVLKSKEYLPNTSTETKPTDVLEIDSGASSDIAESEHSVSGHVSDDVLSSAGSHKSTAPPTTGNKTTSKKDEVSQNRRIVISLALVLSR